DRRAAGLQDLEPGAAGERVVGDDDGAVGDDEPLLAAAGGALGLLGERAGGGKKGGDDGGEQAADHGALRDGGPYLPPVTAPRATVRASPPNRSAGRAPAPPRAGPA